MLHNLKYVTRQIYESIVFAVESVVINKTRTFLSLLGITIGIFAIISVYTAIDTLENYIRHSIEAFNSNQIQVGKWPWGPEEGDTEYKWWKFTNRPEVTEAEFREIQQIMPDIKEASIAISVYRVLKYGSSSSDRMIVIGGTELYSNTRTSVVATGRMLTPFEYEAGSNSALVGSNIAQDLFAGDDPVGKIIKIGGINVNVVGTFEKQGSNMFGESWDDQVLMPMNFVKTLGSFKNCNPEMYLSPEKGANLTEFKELLKSKMRALRRLSPTAEDNFALNDVATASKGLDQIFVMINLAGGIIGLFSILVGGFGVANIMFVSVRERTAQIGIQKALGARRYAIMLQFTFEAIMLSIAGGVVGLFLIWVLTFPASALLDFEIVLTMKNIIIGLGISTLVGAVSGIFPAYSAAVMDPVKAIGKVA